MTIGIYAGSFDCFHIGHLWLVEQAVQDFDRVTILLADNPAKQGRFSLEERLHIVNASLSALRKRQANFEVVVLPQGQMTYEYCHQRRRDTGSKTVLLRGLREAADLTYENAVDSFNASAGVRTVYYMAQYSISSTRVWNDLCEWGISDALCPEAVETALYYYHAAADKLVSNGS